MKRFLLKLSLFAIVFFVVQHLIGMTIGNLNKNTLYNEDGRNRYIRDSVEADIILMGSSRCFHHLNPKIFEDTLGVSCYNCGERRMGILYLFDRFQTILKRYKPHAILYEITPDYDLFVEEDNSVYIKNLRPYYWEDSCAKEIIDSVNSQEHYKLLSKLYSYNGKCLDILESLYLKNITYNKGQAAKTGNLQIRTKPNKQIVHEREFDKLKLYYLKEFIKLCKENGILLVFSSSPLFGLRQGDMFRSFNTFCKDNNIFFLNHYNDKSFSLQPAFYSDAVHLNRLGSDKYSSLLASQLKTIIDNEDKNSVCSH